MKVSLIIAFYKNTLFLDLILEALRTQSNMNFEVIIAEDDNDLNSKKYIDEKIKTLPFTLIHVCQKEDKGFRKNQILNEAIANSNNDLTVFLDGDCIPHKHFIKEYLKNVEENKVLFGRRVMLDESISDKLKDTYNYKYLSLFNLLKSKSTLVEEAIYIPFIKIFKKRHLCGCNWGILKKHLIEVNGFDEDYQKAGVGEDVDIEWRLLGKGFKMKSLKHKAITYHLYHARTYSEEGLQVNYNLLFNKQALNNVYCLVGLDYHLKKSNS